MSDQNYFYRRAERELRMAEVARCPEAVQAHYTLANRYLERVHEERGSTVAA